MFNGGSKSIQNRTESPMEKECPKAIFEEQKEEGNLNEFSDDMMMAYKSLDPSLLLSSAEKPLDASVRTIGNRERIPPIVVKRKVVRGEPMVTPALKRKPILKGLGKVPLPEEIQGRRGLCCNKQDGQKVEEQMMDSSQVAIAESSVDLGGSLVVETSSVAYFSSLESDALSVGNNPALPTRIRRPVVVVCRDELEKDQIASLDSTPMRSSCMYEREADSEDISISRASARDFVEATCSNVVQRYPIWKPRSSDISELEGNDDDMKDAEEEKQTLVETEVEEESSIASVEWNNSSGRSCYQSGESDGDMYGGRSESRQSNDMYQCIDYSASSYPTSDLVMNCDKKRDPLIEQSSASKNFCSRSPFSDRTLSSQSLYSNTTDHNTSSEVSQDLQSSPKSMSCYSGIKIKIKIPKRDTLKESVPDMPKQNTLKEFVPGNAKALLATGLLEGQRVQYLGRGEEVLLTGVIKDGGVLCNCSKCKGKNVVYVSAFEKHAGSNARHPSDFIYLENGKSLHDILEVGKHAPQGGALENIARAIGVQLNESTPKSCSKCGNSGLLMQCLKENCTNASHPDCSGSFQKSGSLWICSKCVAVKLRNVEARTVKTCSYDVPQQRNIETSLIKTSGASAAQLRNTEPPSVKAGHAFQSNQSRDTSLHKLIFLPGGLSDGTELAYYVKGQRFLDGVKSGSGILCSCCNQVLSCSQFEAHSGWASRRNPYISIYLSDGRSLHDVAVEISLPKKERVQSDGICSNDNDDVCNACGNGGDLVLCDGCPGAYHADCAGLFKIPEGDWFCPSCQIYGRIDRRLPGKQAIKGSGKIVRDLAKDKLSGRCQRVVKALENAIGGCVICRNGDFLKSGFGAKTIMLCDQCEREFHVGCLKEKGLADLKELPPGEWFCGEDCGHIHSTLQMLVHSGAKSVHNCASSLVFTSQEHTTAGLADLTWQLLHGKGGNLDDGRILSQVATIFAESFDPIIDISSGRDLIPSMVYSRSIRNQDFGGMYCAVLRCNEIVVSAAIFRIFGRQFAELPLVATSSTNRGKGYFQTLLSTLEQLLGFLQVECLILPAAKGAEEIWTKKFGFSQLHDEQLQKFLSEVQIMTFQGSSMLFKAVSPNKALPVMMAHRELFSA